jgi:hypothetical protein
MSKRMTIRAYDFNLLEKAESTRVSCRLEAEGFPNELFFEVESSLPRPLAAREPNWALVALIYPAMLSGRDLVIEADISQCLWHAAQGDLQGLLRASDARLKKIRVVAGLAPLPERRATGVGTGFSAGIDSFTTLSLYSGNNTPESLRLTDLTVHNVGAFGRGKLVDETFSNACKRAENFGRAMGLGSVFINSNIGDVFMVSNPPSKRFQSTHSFRNAAAAHVLHDSIGCFPYSSTYPFVGIGVTQLAQSLGKDTAHIDPILLPMLSSERMRLVSAGAALSRGEKTRLVSEDDVVAKHLDVCVDPAGRLKHGKINCSRCWKCERTMATLEAIGALDRFGAVFDIEHYQADRKNILKRLTKKAERGSDIDMEVVEMLKASGHSVPWRIPEPLMQFRALVGRVKRVLLKTAS